jgi:hypothetical protein
VIRKLLIGFGLVLVIGFALYRHLHHAKEPLETAYVGNRQVTLWSTAAQVREPVAMMSFGDRVEVLGRFEDEVKVRTMSGVTGWTSQDQLLSAEFWRQAQELETETTKMPIEARGHTRVLTNLHIDPARGAARIRQLDKNVPVDLYVRRAVDVPSAPGVIVAEAGDGSTPAVKKEDWWLVRAHIETPSRQELTISGWLLGRFVDLDVPEPLPDYASAAGMRIVSWYELNYVVGESGVKRPQYLVLGTRSGEGQPCDFTLLRVFTWGKQNRRYETAFVESNLCGKLPLALAAGRGAGGDATFSFEDWSEGKAEVRTYHMHQTIVRLERANDSEPAKRKHGRG